MQQIEFITPAERRYVATLESQSRLRLVNLISRIVLGLGGVYGILFVLFTILALTPNGPFAGLITFAWQPPLLVTADVLIGLALGMVIVAGIVARRKQVKATTIILVGATAVALSCTEIIFAVIPALQMVAHAGLTSLFIVLIIAYVLGATSSLIYTTVGINVISIVVIILSNLSFSDMGMGMGIMSNAQLQILFPETLLAQWIATALLLTIGRTYRQNLTALNNSRIEIGRAQKLDDLKNQFIASVNHELRTPVMALQMLLKTGTLTLEYLTTTEVQELLDRSTRISGNLALVIESVLSLTRIDQEAESPTLEAVSVREALDSAIELIDPRESGTDERELHIRMPAGLTVWGDAVFLRKILTNLISNARKYSDHGTPIEISARLIVPESTKTNARQEKRAPAKVEIVVKDFGLGVPPDQIPYLFNRFVRLPRDLASNVIGNGLGLYLCRVMAEAMHGHIWVESNGMEGEGTEFHLDLPIAAETLAAVGAPSAQPILVG